MIFGRRAVPGDRSLSEQLNPNAPHDRVVRTQVSTVDPDNGVAIVNYDGLPSGGRYITVPPLWMSFPPETAAVGPAWGRYMPQPTDLIKVAFGHDNTPFGIGYDIAAQREGVADDFSGWPELNRLYQEASTNPNTPTERKKFAQFIPLKPGEYDFMSSGGAYIYGNNRGKLYLAGGSVSVSLIKNELRMNTNAQLWLHTADECELRFGQVRRVSDQTTGAEVALNDTAAREFRIEVNRGSRKLAESAIGNVISSTGATLSSTFSQSVIARLAVFNAQSSAVLEQNIDAVGNIEIISPNSTGGIFLDFSAGKWVSKNTEVEVNASAKYSVISPSVNLGGTDAAERLILGSTFIPANMNWAEAVNTSVVDFTTANLTHVSGTTALAAMLTAAAVPMAIPIVGPTIAALIIAAGAATVTGIAGTALGQFTLVAPKVTAAKTVYVTAAGQRYLSSISRTK